MNKPVALACVLASATLLAACGSSSTSSSSSDSSTSTTPAATAPASVAAKNGKITVTGTEYAFAPSAITAKAGKVKITFENKGSIPHELVVLKTSADPGSLPVGSDQRVDEKTSVGEVPEIAAGAKKSTTLDLKPGTYTYVCNIPTHYKDGMRGVLTVK